ncbi:unnamed protein product [Parajaminaea phylloscopi]
MPFLFRSKAETEDPNHLEEPRPHGATSVARGSQNAWQWLIGYNDTEANRVGVPMVSSKDFFHSTFDSPGSRLAAYLDSLFPFTKWIGSYNLQWLVGDVIAGVTVALVVVPQSMSYANLAGLAPEFGLYSSFVGVMIYALFATSKDVTIGPVAVMSLQTHNVIVNVMKKSNAWKPEIIASALAFLCGVICLGIGLFRLGWIVEFIPTPAVSGFMTGSAFTIAAGQVPKLMGIPNINTNGQPTYRVIIDTLKGLPNTKLDAAFGLTSLFALYAIRSACVHIPRRYPKLARPCFFVSVFRSAFVIIVMTIASRVWLGGKYGYNSKKYPISVLKHVPRGFEHVGQPELSTQLFADLGSELPVSVIVLLLEHIAIAKSFGRLNNYKINPNQELIAIGVTNLIGPCFGAYAATGSFSRSAVKAKSGVRTPLAGWITGILVLIAIYALTGTFYWIPSSALSAVIIHAAPNAHGTVAGTYEAPISLLSSSSEPLSAAPAHQAHISPDFNYILGEDASDKHHVKTELGESHDAWQHSDLMRSGELANVFTKLAESCDCGGIRTISKNLAPQWAAQLLSVVTSPTASALIDANIIQPGDPHSMTVTQYHASKHIQNRTALSSTISHRLKMPRFPIETMPQDAASDAALPLDPWFLGLWLGDGDHDKARITSHSSDVQVHQKLERLVDVINESRPIGKAPLHLKVYRAETFGNSHCLPQ